MRKQSSAIRTAYNMLNSPLKPVLVEGAWDRVRRSKGLVPFEAGGTSRLGIFRTASISKLGRELAELQLTYQRYVWAVVMKEEREEVPEYSNLTITVDENALKEYVEKVRLDKENREITINGKVKVQGIPEFALECKVGNYPPIRWVSEYLVREEDKDTGIVWDPMLKVEEFVDIVKKLIAFSERCLEIKHQLSEIYEASNQVKIPSSK